MRTPSLPPTFAKFKVPYSFNKLDLRDYLFNVYGVRALSVRSFIKYMPVRQDKPDQLRPKPRRWFRPRGKKYMTVEMDKPFVWPSPPTDFEMYVWIQFIVARRRWVLRSAGSFEERFCAF